MNKGLIIGGIIATVFAVISILMVKALGGYIAATGLGIFTGAVIGGVALVVLTIARLCTKLKQK